MNSNDINQPITLEKEYEELMKDFENQNIPFQTTPQWTSPNDYIVKFSLYQEMPNSITSTETSVTL